MILYSKHILFSNTEFEHDIIEATKTMSAERSLMSHRLVTIGAGSGHFTLIDGAKEENDPKKITAVVAFADDGSDSGRWRAELGVLPPGDARQCILALTPDHRQSDIGPMLNFRFPKNGEDLSGIGGRNVGNLLIAALETMYGCQELALKQLMKNLDIPGRVIPASHNKVNLEAVLTDGSVLHGENVIDNRGQDKNYDPSLRIRYVRFDQPTYLNPNASEAIEQAEYIVIAPGDLYTSILPIFLVNGIADALMLTKAKLIYCGNLMTKKGETDDFKASDCLSEVCNYLGDRRIDFAFLNQRGSWSEEVPQDVIDSYAEEGKYLIETDRDECQKLLPQARIVEAPLVRYIPRQRLVRHDGRKLAYEMRKVIEESEE